MGSSVICNGCGQPLEVPDDYQRKKIRCPQCGVFCELPTPAKSTATAKPMARPEPAVPPGEPERASEARAPDPRETKKAVRTCRECGEPVRVAEGKRGRDEKCPMCGASLARKKDRAAPRETRIQPTTTPPPRPAPLRPQPARPAPPVGTHADDGNPYPVGGPEEYRCPACAKPLAADAVLCAACGLNLETGAKAVREYQPLERSWEAGLPFRRRVQLFAIFQGVFWLLGLLAIGARDSPLVDEVGVLLFSWLVLTGMTSFIFGTFDRLDVKRTRRGKVVLTKTWRICFIPRPTETVSWREYEGLVTGRSHDSDLTDWLVFFVLFSCGVVPAVIWWWVRIRPDTYFVALSRDHGFPEAMLHRSSSHPRMEEVAAVLQDATGLPRQGV
jgi:hypothetical protein